MLVQEQTGGDEAGARVARYAGFDVTHGGIENERRKLRVGGGDARCEGSSDALTERDEDIINKQGAF